jgi:hypothetical protein
VLGWVKHYCELEKVGASGGANIAIVSARGMNPNEGLVVHGDRM